MNRFEFLLSISTCAATHGDGASLMIKPTDDRTDGWTAGVNDVHMRGGVRPNHLASIHDVKRAQVLHDEAEHEEAVYVEEEHTEEAHKGGSGGRGEAAGGEVAGLEAAGGEAAGGTSQAEKRAAEDKRRAKRDGVRRREEAEKVGRCRLTPA